MSETISGQLCEGARLTAIAAFCTCYRGCQILIPHCSLQTRTQTYTTTTTTPHFGTSLKYWQPGPKAFNTQARSTFSTYLHTWIVKRASPAASLWGSNFQVYLTLLPPKPAFDNQPLTNSILT
jgi:hypothetical protein